MKKKKRQPDPPQVDLLPVMTVSLFLILLTFFILLNSIAVIDERRVRSALGSIMGAFGSYTGGYSASKTGEMLIPPGAPMALQDVDFVKVLNLEQTDIADYVELIYSDGKQKISVNSRFLFVPGTLELQPEARQFLDRLAGVIAPASYPVEIMGHARGTSAIETGYGSSWEHASHMASAVYDYMKTTGAVPDTRLNVYGAGGYRPRFPTGTRRSREMNERVDIVLYANAQVDTHRILKKKPSNIFTFDTFDFRIFD
jgi:chemotaxis protein MotB